MLFSRQSQCEPFKTWQTPGCMAVGRPAGRPPAMLRYWFRSTTSYIFDTFLSPNQLFRMTCLTTGLCLPPIRRPAEAVCRSGHFRHLIGTGNGCRINVDSNDMLHVGVFELLNCGTFRHRFSLLWSTWAT